MRSILRHLRAQPVAYLALFTSLSGSAVAVQAIDGRLLIDKSVDQTKVNETIQKRKPQAPPVCESGYIKSMSADGGVICGDAISKSTDAEKLGGKSAEEYLLKLEKAKQAENADMLGGKTKDDFLGKLEKAQEAVKADKLGDKTAADFLAATGKAADADKLDGIDSSGFVQVRVGGSGPTGVVAIDPHSCISFEGHAPGARLGDLILAQETSGPTDLPPNVTAHVLGVPRDDRVSERFCNHGTTTAPGFAIQRRFLVIR